jgi:acetyltransferase EpsM
MGVSEMKKVIVLGGKGIGVIAASIIDMLPDMGLIGLLNDGVPPGETQGRYKKLPVLGPCEDVHKYIENDDIYAIVAYKTMKKEKTMWEKLLRLNIPREKLINVIHPTAVIPKDYCEIGRGVMMAANSQLSTDVRVSDNFILLGNCFISHDCTLERYVSVANHVSIGAEVHVGKAVHIGSNSTIAAGVVIGENSIIGIGSLVLKDVPPNSVVFGSPAKVVATKEE